MWYEMNLDGLVGPTHNYSGLSYGNLPSMQNQHAISNPKEAALQGLQKMKFLADLGLMQGILPPHERPHLPTLRVLGFEGTDAGSIASAYARTPEFFYTVCSAASMWAANSATVSPSPDSIDKHVHFTTANLASKFHRTIESGITEKILKLIFKNSMYFKHHSSLPPTHFPDEGAANHTRFCKDYGTPGVQLFTYGRHVFSANPLSPKLFPARQSVEASLAIFRLHQLYPERVIFAQQNPAAIDAGAFHNDVVAVGNMNVFFFHELAYVGKDNLINEIRTKVANSCDVDMIFLEVKDAHLSLKDAIDSYLFNSQLVTLPEGGMCLLAPIECQENDRVKKYLEDEILAKDNPISRIHYLDLRQSMRNGGGPACLRLRVVVNEKEIEAVHPHIFLNERLYRRLRDWISKHYRDHLELKDLSDPKLYHESQEALDELTKILQLGPLYDFQKPQGPHGITSPSS